MGSIANLLHRPSPAIAAAKRILSSTTSTQRALAGAPPWKAGEPWSFGAVHSGIRYVKFDADNVAVALRGVPGGAPHGVEIAKVGTELDTISRSLDDAARSAGPFDLSAATRAEFAGKLERPLADAARLSRYAATALDQSAHGARALR